MYTSSLLAELRYYTSHSPEKLTSLKIYKQSEKQNFGYDNYKKKSRCRLEIELDAILELFKIQIVTISMDIAEKRILAICKVDTFAIHLRRKFTRHMGLTASKKDPVHNKEWCCHKRQ